MATLEDVKTWRGCEAVGPDGEKVGKIDDIYLDRQSGEPEWAAVKTGLFGTNVSFVPLQGASESDDAIRLNYDKATVKDAPNVEADGELSPEEERRLYDYYGRSDYGDWTDESEDRTETFMGRDERVGRGERFETDADRDRDADVRGFTDRDAAEGRDVEIADRDRDTVGRGEGDVTDDAMTRSEEELRVGTTRRATGRARLRKFVVTEDVETSVPVQREEVRVEREPITDENREAAMSGPDISEAEHEVTLHSEEPVVEKEVVPKERVRLETDAVTEERGVSEEVRKERIEPEGEGDVRREQL
jgi:uncharacterized protein (TIGR02271 family)